MNVDFMFPIVMPLFVFGTVAMYIGIGREQKKLFKAGLVSFIASATITLFFFILAVIYN